MNYQIFNVNDFNWSVFDEMPTVYKIGNNGGAHSKVINQICAFDIETSKMPFEEQTFMYVWQFCVKDIGVIVGRTWQEFKTLVAKINCHIKKNKLICFIHNCSFEFSFLKGIYEFKPEDVFCTDSRKILYCRIGNIEFRCSYLLTNRSLESWCEVCNPEHKKTEMEYTKLRFPWTPLTDAEIEYCINDVISLCECVQIEMERRNDTLATLPRTSTGFIRREVKRALSMIGPWYKEQIPDLEQYQILRSAYRGGNCHASSRFACNIVQNVTSYDLSSSYPAQMLEENFPMHPYIRIKDRADFEYQLQKENESVIFRCHIKNMKLRKDKIISVPYVAVANCEKYHCEPGQIDNGRLLAGDILACFTEIDFEIIKSQYVWNEKDFEFINGYHTKKEKLPAQLRRLVAFYYEQKTALKGVVSRETDYRIAKEYINSIYGMMVQDPLKVLTIFCQDKIGNEQFQPDKEKTIEKRMEEYKNRGWLPYQWGVYVCCFARQRLQRAINLVDESPNGFFIYTDTDSVKYCGEVDFEPLNAELRKKAIQSWGVAKDSKGEKHYIGVYEKDGFYDEFLTCGAKIYFTETQDKDGIWHAECTVSGIPKKMGSKYVEYIGGIKYIRPREHMVFPASYTGKLTAKYNDNVNETRIIVDDTGEHELHITDNVYLKPADYTLFVHDDYWDLLESMQALEKLFIDMAQVDEYNVAIEQMQMFD